MVYPIIPLFVTGVLKAPVAYLGIIEGAAESLVSIMKGASGFWSDATGKRASLVAWGYVISNSAKPLLGLSTIWYGALGARLLDRFGKGVRTTARDAMIADAAEPEEYGRAFGFHRAMDTAGALIGVLLVYFLITLSNISFRNIFLLSGIPGFIAVLLVMTIKDKERPRTPKAESKPALPKLELPPEYWRALSLCALFAVANSSDALILLRANKVGLSFANVILAYACYNVTYMVGSSPFAKLSDRIGRWWLIGIGWFVFAISYAGLAFTNDHWIWLLFPLYGVYMALTDGVSKALIADASPKDAKGRAMGLFYMVTGFGTLAASTFGGWLWDAKGQAAPFIFSAAVAMLSVVLIPVTRPLAR
ncbi:MAG: MFS transporter [Armatimonadetes bacterium]|nr:MFS transporter [Armatimonadota bacterium]